MQRTRDVDLLMIIREEAVYAERIRDALVFSETKLDRGPVPLVALDESMREARRSLYTRPTSIAERTDEREEDIYTLTTSKARRSCRSKGREPLPPASEDENVATSTQPYINPLIDRRRTVEDNDALYSAAATGGKRVEFTYNDLIATRENRKITTVRALRRLANLWDINPKLNKEEMLSRLITEYARRYPDEVEAYEARRTTTRTGKARRQPRRRRH